MVSLWYAFLYLDDRIELVRHDRSPSYAYILCSRTLKVTKNDKYWMSRLKNCDLGEKKKKTLYTLFCLLHKRVELSIFFFFENFDFAVDEWWYNNYNNKNISIYIAAFARGCKALLPIITVSEKLSQPASQSYSFTEGCYWPSAHLTVIFPMTDSSLMCSGRRSNWD